MVLAVGHEARDPSNGTPGPGNAAAADATDVGAKDHGAKDAPVWRDPRGRSLQFFANPFVLIHFVHQ